MYTYIFGEIHKRLCMSNYVLSVEIKMKYKYTSPDSFPYSTEKNRNILIFILYKIHLDY